MASELKKIVRPQRLSENVCAELESRIRSGAYAPGEQLPTEKLLAANFDVSRAVIREAVARLKADGLIESRQGSGAFVAARPKSLNFKIAETDEARQTLAHVMELRALVEMTVSELAARRRSPEDLDAMRAHLSSMDEALRTDGDGSDADDGFHAAIAAATHNPLVQRFVEFLGQHFSESRRLTWMGDCRAAGSSARAQEEHWRLFQAIAAGQSASARRLAFAHLSGAARRVGLDLAPDLGGEACIFEPQRRKGAEERQ
ncbi:MAG: FadR/GntR family transcriptional regulator [Rhodocyclaceae bacterium]|nr:FadR/GntR family transcriptional regulator [Rhodocyclaceae bacterium]